MKIVVTGAAGYIGSCLCKMLLDRKKIKIGGSTFINKDIEIKAFDNFTYDQWDVMDQDIYADDRITLYRQDCNAWSKELTQACKEADFIFPLAAIVGAPACDDHPDESYNINYSWFETLLGRLDGSQKIIYPNTNSGYGTTPKGSICTERTKTNPISLYGKLKQRAEDFLLEKYDNTVCFRLATVFGLSGRPRLDLMVNNFVYRAVNEGEIEIFDGHYRRNFISVKDVCRAFMFSMSNKNFKKMKGKVYNLGTDSLNSTKMEFARKIEELTGCEINERQFKTDPDKRDYIVSNKKLTSLGFRCEDTSLDDSVKELVRFCKRAKTTHGMFNY